MKYKKDYYQILGVKPNATQEEIKQAYRRLAILNHPDKNPTRRTEVQMQEVNEAYSVIGIQDKRIKYDYEYLNSTTTAQTKDSSYSMPENLQQIFTEENTGFDRLVFFLIITMVFLLFSVAFPFFDWYMAHPFLSILITVLGLFFVSDMLTRWKSSKSREKENQCPRCCEVWAAEKLSGKLMGIFRKTLSSGGNGDEGTIFVYEKYKTHYKCKYCSYEWLYIKTKRL